MLVFVLNAEHTPLLQQTLDSVQAVAANWTVIPVRHKAASRLNERLASDRDPFFLTLQAGDKLLSAFPDEVAHWLERLQQEIAVLFLAQSEQKSISEIGVLLRNHSAIWRTSAVLEAGGFPEPEELPVEEYLLPGMLEKMKPRWMWDSVVSSAWKPYLLPTPAWRREEIEWSLLRPFMQRDCVPPQSKASPQVSVVVCSYNDASYLPFAIRSVFSQTLSDWELILVDDGSLDDTQNILEMFAKKSRVHCIINPKNVGKAHSLNRALTVARGDWLLELDADDWLTPDCLASLVETAEKTDPSAAVVYADHYEWREQKRKQIVYQATRNAPASLSPETLLSAGVPLAPRLYRTSVLKEEQGWLTVDPFEGRMYEDIQMLVRLLWKGYSFHYLPKPLYHRRLRPFSVTHRHTGRYPVWRSWMEKHKQAADLGSQ